MGSLKDQDILVVWVQAFVPDAQGCPTHVNPNNFLLIIPSGCFPTKDKPAKDEMEMEMEMDSPRKKKRGNQQLFRNNADQSKCIL